MPTTPTKKAPAKKAAPRRPSTRKAPAVEPILPVVDVPLDQLKLDPRNARRHSRRNLDAIRGSLQRFGQRQALTVRSDLTVIVGNGRLEVMRELGWQRAAVSVVPDEWSDDEARAYALADNQSGALAEWDPEVLAEQVGELTEIGFDLQSLGFDGLPAISGGRDDDVIPAPPAKPITKPGDTWRLGPHRVTCGSATDPAAWSRVLAGRRVDLVLTDPPYGVDYQTKNHKPIAGDAADDDETLRLLIRDTLALAFEHARPGCPVYLFHADVKRVLVESAMTAAGMKVHQTLVWVKDRFVLARFDYQPQYEPILYGWKPGGRHSWYGGRKRTSLLADEAPDFDAMDRDQLLAFLQAVYEDTTVIRHDRPTRSPEHPTMKPVGLLSRLLVNSAKAGALVFDPFLGSGSTLIAAERQGRVCAGTELEPAYVDVIVRRWETATGGKAELDGEG